MIKLTKEQILMLHSELIKTTGGSDGIRDIGLLESALENPFQSCGGEELYLSMDNIFVRTDPAGNIKPDKEKSTEKIDGAVAAVMALDRAVRNGGSTGSVYDERGILSF